MEVFATGYHRSAIKLKQVRVCPTCTMNTSTGIHVPATMTRKNKLTGGLLVDRQI